MPAPSTAAPPVVAEGRGFLDALRLGFACATDNCRTPLAGRLDGAEVARLVDLVAIERA